ncbi:MAG: hypothetical protein COA44_00220 [Arcobacter sp.]|nr:MAG: hypothetical protein COA44_00220 [Arcobacter sp.]
MYPLKEEPKADAMIKGGRIQAEGYMNFTQIVKQKTDVKMKTGAMVEKNDDINKDVIALSLQRVKGILI